MCWICFFVSGGVPLSNFNGLSIVLAFCSLSGQKAFPYAAIAMRFACGRAFRRRQIRRGLSAGGHWTGLGQWP